MTIELYDQKNLSVISTAMNINALSTQVGKCLTNNYQKTIAELKEDVLTGNVYYELKIEKYRQCIEKNNDILQNIKAKPVIPEFNEIEVLKTDIHEIKKFIRKTNYDFISFHCNNKEFDKQYEKIDSEIGQLFESNEYKLYDALIESFASTLYHIIKYDEVGKVVEHYEVLNLEDNVKKLVDLSKN